MSTWSWHDFTEQLAGLPMTWHRLLIDHVPTEGGLCRACGRPGYGTPVQPWPCTLHKVAERAAELHNVGQPAPGDGGERTPWSPARPGEDHGGDPGRFPSESPLAALRLRRDSLDHRHREPETTTVAPVAEATAPIGTDTQRAT